MAYKEKPTQTPEDFYKAMTPQQLNVLQSKVQTVLNENLPKFETRKPEAIVEAVTRVQQAMKMSPENCDGKWGGRTEGRYQGWNVVHGVTVSIGEPVIVQPKTQEPRIQLKIGKIEIVQKPTEVVTLTPIVIPLKKPKVPEAVARAGETVKFGDLEKYKKPVAPPVLASTVEVPREKAEVLPVTGTREKYQITMRTDDNHSIVIVSNKPYDDIYGKELQRLISAAIEKGAVYDENGRKLGLSTVSEKQRFMQDHEAFYYKGQKQIKA